MDRRDFVRPHGFHVRYYDDTLSYRVHNVIPYKTALPGHLIYKVMRSRDKVNLWYAEDEIVAQLDAQGQGMYQSFSPGLSAGQIVCAVLSHSGKLVVLDDDSVQPGLF